MSDARSLGTVDDSEGRELHREFIGMLFALAIGEVAVKAGTTAHSGAPWDVTTAASLHLILATIVITTSWIGWGRSKFGLQDAKLRHTFTRDFVELLIDVWLVVIYFLICEGVDVSGDSSKPSVASMRPESLWILAMFVTYCLWDWFTKHPQGYKRTSPLIQRGWASFLCAALASITFAIGPRKSTDFSRVSAADVALICLVLLFRAAKLQQLKEMRRREWQLVICLTGFWALSIAFASS